MRLAGALKMGETARNSRIRRIGHEHSSSVLFDRFQGMIIIDLLGEKFAFREDDLANRGIIGLADCFPHVGRLEDRPIFVKQSLVVSKMIRIDCGCA